jgi:glycosyltransferase involved in cell wall biosynthesis
MAVEVGCDKELVIVDDQSKDGTRDFLQRLIAEKKPNITVVLHEKNQGKGAAIRTGLSHVTGDLVLIQDADLEYDPADYPRLLEPLLKGQADVVFGNRFHGGVHRVLYFWHALGNQGLTFLSNLLTNLNLSDMEVGYKVFRTDVLQRISLKSNRFGFEPEVTAKVAKLGCRIYEVPIAYHGRTYAEGKKITWKDGFSALWCLVRFRFFD